MIHCTASHCWEIAPKDLQWRLVMASKASDVAALFGNLLDSHDCPLCGAKSSIAPSLAGLFIVENMLIVLDRGFDPEKSALDAIAPLIAGLGVAPIVQRVEDVGEFKSLFAATIKATAKRYPYPTFDPSPDAMDLYNWQDLQGEILTAILVGATGIVPKLGIHAGQTDGTVAGIDRTVEVIQILILEIMTKWAIGLAELTKETGLEELLLGSIPINFRSRR